MQLSLTSILILVSSLAYAQNISAAKPSSFVMCRNKKIVRTLRVESGGDDGVACTTTYTKAGIDKVVGTGKFEPSCQNFLTNVRKNLEEAGWVCKEKTEITISSSSQ